MDKRLEAEFDFVANVYCEQKKYSQNKDTFEVYWHSNKSANSQLPAFIMIIAEKQKYMTKEKYIEKHMEKKEVNEKKTYTERKPIQRK